MTKAQLQQRLAKLESLHDQMESEILYLDKLMKEVGFSGGLAAVKASAREIISQGYLKHSSGPSSDQCSSD